MTTTVKPKQFTPVEEQMAVIGNCRWSVSRLIELSKSLPVLNIPMTHLGIGYIYDQMNLRELAGHIEAINKADLSYPIILDENGDVMDGRHRIVKAILVGASSIKAVRFEENPEPCEYMEE